MLFRPLLQILLPAILLVVPFARAEEPPVSAACVAALSTEEEFRARLPKRLQNLLSNDRVRNSLVINRHDYTHLFATLDRSRENSGRWVDFHFGGLSVGMRAGTSVDGHRLFLNVEYVAKSELHLGETGRHGREFLNFILGLTEWASRQVAKDSAGKIRRIEIQGENLQNLRLIELLQGLGFTASAGPSGNCTVIASVAGVFGGFGGMILMHLVNEKATAGESFTALTAGAGLATVLSAARLCSDIRGKDYRLVIELPR